MAAARPCSRMSSSARGLFRSMRASPMRGVEKEKRGCSGARSAPISSTEACFPARRARFSLTPRWDAVRIGKETGGFARLRGGRAGMNWSRPEAEALLFEWTQRPRLRSHARAGEAALRAYARKYGEDEELWGLTGLLHDLDYERHPTREEHPRVGGAHLRGKGAPEVMLQAILGHAEYLDVPRETRLA